MCLVLLRRKWLGTSLSLEVQTLKKFSADHFKCESLGFPEPVNFMKVGLPNVEKRIQNQVTWRKFLNVKKMFHPKIQPVFFVVSYPDVKKKSHPDVTKREIIGYDNNRVDTV